MSNKDKKEKKEQKAKNENYKKGQETAPGQLKDKATPPGQEKKSAGPITYPGPREYEKTMPKKPKKVKKSKKSTLPKPILDDDEDSGFVLLGVRRALAIIVIAVIVWFVILAIAGGMGWL